MTSILLFESIFFWNLMHALYFAKDAQIVLISNYITVYEIIN